MRRTGHGLSAAEIRQRYSQIAKNVTMPRYFYSYIADLVAQHCSGGRVLDVGCGNGYLLEQVARRRPDLELWGVESASALVMGTQSRGNRRWHVISGSALELPFRSSSFQMITLTEVLEHMKDPVQVLREIARTLRQQGRLLLTVPNMSAYSPFWRVAERIPLGPLQRAFLPWEHPLKTFQPIDTAYEFEEIQQIIREAGLTVEALWGREFFPYVTASIPMVRRLYARFAQSLTDEALGRVLPARMGYRLILQCRA